MNKIERQILNNQRIMFSVLTSIYTKTHEGKERILIDSMNKCYWDTIELLEEKESKKEDCCEMPKKFAEQKKGERQ